MKKLKRTIDEIRKESDLIHNNSFIIHSISFRKNNTTTSKRYYIDTECKVCGTRKWKTIDNHINKKYKCNECRKWTLEKVQKESDKIHNNQFIIKNIIREAFARVTIFCKICGYETTVNVSSHISQQRGCGGKCKHKTDRKLQIENLKNNPTLAQQQYKLYFLKFTNKKEKFYKIGKTKYEISTRFNYPQYSDYNIEICQVVKSNHLWVAKQEDEFINKYYDKYGYIPKQKFDGYTECFKAEIIGEFS